MSTRVRLFANWDTSYGITQRLIEQFQLSGADYSEVTFVVDDDYDIAIYFNYVTDIPNKAAKRYVIPQEPYWSGNHVKHIPPDTTQYFVYDKSKYDTFNNIIEHKATTFYGGRGPNSEGNDWNIDNIINKCSSIQKTKNISSVITTWGMQDTLYPDSCTYNDRCEIMQHILTSKLEVDIFGGWQEFYKDSRINVSPLKIESLLPYKFQLVIENEYSKNWITEKFYDAILCETIPIYYGCLNIEELYSGGYILLEDPSPETVERCISNILQSPNEIYMEKLHELRNIKYDYIYNNNLLTLICSICNGEYCE